MWIGVGGQGARFRGGPARLGCEGVGGQGAGRKGWPVRLGCEGAARVGRQGWGVMQIVEVSTGTVNVVSHARTVHQRVK